MKKIALILTVIFAAAFGASAQKFALVDMEYVLQNIPAYEIANQQLDQLSQRWQKEVDQLSQQAADLYKDYRANMVFLTDDQKKKKEEEITAKEKETAELRNKYFGPEGDVYNAVKAVSEERGYQCIFDRASSADIIFASPRIDISNEVLAKLGFSK